MAARYPGAKILGIDIAPIQSKLVPQNVEFEVADVEEPWTMAPASVDFVHVRSLAGMIRNWPALLAQAFDKLRPGGLLEVTDVRGRVLNFDGKFGEDEVTPHLSRLFQEMASKEGTIFDTASQIPGWLHDEGFEKVAQRTEILPLGAWPKDKKLRAREKLTTAMVLPWFRESTHPPPELELLPENDQALTSSRSSCTGDIRHRATSVRDGCGDRARSPGHRRSEHQDLRASVRRVPGILYETD